MAWLDILILFLLIGGIIKGGRRGLIKSIVLVFSLVLAFNHCWGFASWLQENALPLLDWDVQSYRWLPVIFSFLVIYVSTYSILSLLTSVLRIGPLKLIDHILGAFLGFVISIYALGYIFMLTDTILTRVSSVVDNDTTTDIRAESKLYYPIRNSITDLEGIRLHFEKYLKESPQ